MLTALIIIAVLAFILIYAPELFVAVFVMLPLIIIGGIMALIVF